MMFRKVFKRHSAGDIYLLVMVHTALILSTAACSICLAELPHTRTSAIAGNEEREIWLLSSRKAVVRFKRPTAEARKEWEESAIASDIIDENLISVPDMAYLPGTSRLVYPLLDLLGLESSFRSGGYEPSWDRIGWTYRGYDPLTDAEASTFEIKPIPAIRKYEVGPSKYEHTAVNPRMAFLRMTRWRANSILRSPIGEQCQDPTLCFWRAVKDSSIPVIVTEGAKKAGSLLSAGYAALSIPGTCRRG